MKKLFLAAVAISALSIGATGAIAHNHEGGDHKGKMMERLDTDGDGAVSKAEFMAKYEEKFVKMDKDGDGLISSAEMEAAKSKWQEMKKKYKEMKQPAAE